MAKPKILLQFDTDAAASVFDAVVATDAGVDRLLQYSGVRAESVRELVYGAMFTRAPDELKGTAIFVGGSNVSAGESVVGAIEKTFFGPLRVSVLMDCNGANTTAAAAVLAAREHLGLQGATALVLGATGPVGGRVARLLAGERAKVRVGSRSTERAAAVCEAVRSQVPESDVSPWATSTDDETAAALEGAALVVAAGAAGVELLAAETRRGASALQVAIDLNAVPPTGLAGVDPQDRAVEHDGVVCYGAIGVGGTKMKIHKAAVRRLFESNDQILDAEQIYQLGLDLS